MDALAKEYLVSFYEKRLMTLGDVPDALGWSPAGQQTQYRFLLQIAEDLTGKGILDYGCGKGDLYEYLKAAGIEVNYTGFDINPSLIKLAREKYPDCSFRVFDIEEEGLHEPFDFIFLCGVFNNKVEGVTDTLKAVLKRLFAHAREGLVFSALSSGAQIKDFELNYTDPVEMLEFAHREITPYAGLAHSGDHYIMHLYRRPDDRKA